VKIRLKIDGVDHQAYLLDNSWTIDDNDGSVIDSIELELLDETNTLSIVRDKDLIVEDFDDATTRFFAGIITEVVIVPEGIGRIWNITAQDWKLILDRATFQKDYVNDTDKVIIQDAFVEAGITEINTSDLVESSRIIERASFRGSTLRQMMETTSKITGFFWDINKFKKLVYRTPNSTLAAFNFSDAADESSTFFYQNISLRQRSGQYNSVEVIGGKRLSSDVVNIYSGNGTKKVFHLTMDNADVIGQTYKQIFREPEFQTDGETENTGKVILVQENTGTNASPVWTDRLVGIEDQDTLGEAGIQVIWNPEIWQLEWASAPPNFSLGAWRVRGRYWGHAIWSERNETAIDTSGREFKKVLNRPEIETDDEAHDIATAFLEEQGPEDGILLNFDKDGLIVGSLVKVTSSALGLTGNFHRVRHLSTSVIGGTVIKYSAVLDSSGHAAAALFSSFAKDTHEVQKQAAVTLIRLVTEKYSLTNAVVTAVGRDGRYYSGGVSGTSVRTNAVTNPSFEDGLTGWTQYITATGTTAKTSEKSKHGNSSLKLVMTNSGSAGHVVQRYFDITVVAGEVWEIGGYGLATALTGGAKAYMTLRWLNSAGSSISSGTEEWAVDTVFTRRPRDASTAPSGAVTLRIELYIIADASGNTGTLYFDSIDAQKIPGDANYFDGFINGGSWQGSDNNSVSIKDDDGDAIVASYFAAS
jgi:hypothetical protein